MSFPLVPPSCTSFMQHSQELNEILILLRHSDIDYSFNVIQAVIELLDLQKLAKVFHEVVLNYLISEELHTRLNSSQLLFTICNKYRNQLLKLLQERNYSTNNKLISIESISIERILEKKHFLYSGKSSYAKECSDGKLYNKKWLKQQQMKLRYKLGLGGISTHKSSVLIDAVEALDNLITEEDIIIKETSSASKTGSDRDEDNEKKIDRGGHIQENDGESWFTRIIRFMTIGLLDVNWEVRHGCSCGLTSIINGLNSSVRMGDENDLTSLIQPNVLDTIITTDEQFLRLPDHLLNDMICCGILLQIIDHFIDFSEGNICLPDPRLGTSKGSSIAPVRDAVAQLIAYASPSLNDRAMTKSVFQMICDIIASHDHWLIRLGGLMTLKYFLASQSSFMIQFISNNCDAFFSMLRENLIHPIDAIVNVTTQLFTSLYSIFNESKDPHFDVIHQVIYQFIDTVFPALSITFDQLDELSTSFVNVTDGLLHIARIVDIYCMEASNPSSYELIQQTIFQFSSPFLTATSKLFMKLFNVSNSFQRSQCVATLQIALEYHSSHLFYFISKDEQTAIEFSVLKSISSQYYTLLGHIIKAVSTPSVRDVGDLFIVSKTDQNYSKGSQKERIRQSQDSKSLLMNPYDYIHSIDFDFVGIPLNGISSDHQHQLELFAQVFKNDHELYYQLGKTVGSVCVMITCFAFNHSLSGMKLVDWMKVSKLVVCSKLCEVIFHEIDNQMELRIQALLTNTTIQSENLWQSWSKHLNALKVSTIEVVDQVKSSNQMLTETNTNHTSLMSGLLDGVHPTNPAGDDISEDMSSDCLFLHYCQHFLHKVQSEINAILQKGNNEVRPVFNKTPQAQKKLKFVIVSETSNDLDSFDDYEGMDQKGSKKRKYDGECLNNQNNIDMNKTTTDSSYTMKSNSLLKSNWFVSLPAVIQMLCQYVSQYVPGTQQLTSRPLIFTTMQSIFNQLHGLLELLLDSFPLQSLSNCQTTFINQLTHLMEVGLLFEGIVKNDPHLLLNLIHCHYPYELFQVWKKSNKLFCNENYQPVLGCPAMESTSDKVIRVELICKLICKYLLPANTTQDLVFDEAILRKLFSNIIIEQAHENSSMNYSLLLCGHIIKTLQLPVALQLNQLFEAYDGGNDSKLFGLAAIIANLTPTNCFSFIQTSKLLTQIVTNLCGHENKFSSNDSLIEVSINIIILSFRKISTIETPSNIPADRLDGSTHGYAFLNQFIDLVLIVLSEPCHDSKSDRVTFRRVAMELFSRLSSALNHQILPLFSIWFSSSLQGLSHWDSNIRHHSTKVFQFLIQIARLASRYDPSKVNPITSNQIKTSMMTEHLDASDLVRIRSEAMKRAELLMSQLFSRTSHTSIINESKDSKDLFICSYLEKNTNLVHSSTIATLVPNELRPYQWKGVSWLTQLRRCGLSGGILADEMGLGKTIQALIFLAVLRIEKSSEGNGSTLPSLVICPASMVLQWHREIQQYFPSRLLKPIRYKYSQDQLSDDQSTVTHTDDDFQLLGSNEVWIVSYETLRSDFNKYFKRTSWETIILDEGHLIKNPRTAVAKSIFQLVSKYKIILTGTPIQNRVEELWSLMNFIIPDYLGDYQDFHMKVVGPIKKSFTVQKTIRSQESQLYEIVDRVAVNSSAVTSKASLDKFYSNIGIASMGMKLLRQLHKQVLPFVLRRTKDSVAKDLPTKTIVNILCPLSETQQSMYKAFLNGLQISDDVLENELKPFLAQSCSPGKKPSSSCIIQPFKMLHYLNLLCVHPGLVIDKCHHRYRNRLIQSPEVSGKLMKLVQLLLDASVVQFDEVHMTSNDEKIDENEESDDSESLIMDDVYKDIDEDERDEKVEVDPTRINALDEWIRSNKATAKLDRQRTSKCLIFAQHLCTLDLIEKIVLKKYFPTIVYQRLDGMVPANKRSIIAEKFNNQQFSVTSGDVMDTTDKENDTRILLMTTRSCGLGLNLTAADTVIFVEHDWNPYADLQAMDRVHRIGQHHPVTVYKLLAESTIEARIIGLQNLKQTMANEIINENNTGGMHETSTGEVGNGFGSMLWDSMNIQKESEEQSTELVRDLEASTLEALIQGVSKYLK